jgi:hypothetical protein
MFECFKCLPDEECYLNLPDNMIDTNPLGMDKIKEQQDADDALLHYGTKYADQYTRKRIGTIDDILCYIMPGILQTIGKCIIKKPAATNN